MASLNRIILVGRLTADPEIRSTIDGTSIAKFQLAVERGFSAGSQKEIDYVDIVAWRALADLSQNSLKKGMLALVEGKIHNRSFETKEGAKKYVTEINANNITVLEGALAPVAAKPKKQEVVANDNTAIEEFLEDDLPF